MTFSLFNTGDGIAGQQQNQNYVLTGIEYHPPTHRLNLGQLTRTYCLESGIGVGSLSRPLEEGWYYTDRETGRRYTDYAPYSTDNRQCVNPYDLPADQPAPASWDAAGAQHHATLGLSNAMPHQESVAYAIVSERLDISANLSPIPSHYGSGIYTSLSGPLRRTGSRIQLHNTRYGGTPSPRPGTLAKAARLEESVRMMRVPGRASNFIKTVRPWLKAVLSIAIAGALLTLGLFLWTARIHYDPWSPLYEYQTEIQIALAAFTGVLPATLIYFGVTGQRFIATTVIAFILMSATAIAALVFGVAEEKVGLETLAGLIAFPLTAAVATKAANIASQKKDDASIGKKFKDSFDEALRSENMAELFLWTVAWVSGGLGVFLLIKAIGMW